jgi:A/G-specific adenine glycosylase
VNKAKNFRNNLLAWAAQNSRPMPWKGEKDPYKIWLSEIILQQTRVEQGLPYFERFVKKYPRVTDLANAPEDEVMKLWEGLGYYSRARNLHYTAKVIATDYDGKFPTQHSEILKLKGIGAYTAAAIASFAFDLPHAVVDGNVYRVLSRIYGIPIPIDSSQGQKEFATLANELLDTQKPAIYNQAIMDFGATHCVPQQPKCSTCQFSTTCVAHQTQQISYYPVKSKTIQKKERYLIYFVLNESREVYVKRREENDIWRNLYEFPKKEVTKTIFSSHDINSLLKSSFDFTKEELEGMQVIQFSKTYKHLLTHQTIFVIFYEILVSNPLTMNESYIKKDKIHLKKILPFPKVIQSYLEESPYI